MKYKKTIAFLFGFILAITMGFWVQYSLAQSRIATSPNNKNVTFTITDSLCTSLPELKDIFTQEAYIFDGTTGKTIHGCAFDNGKVASFEMMDLKENKFYSFSIPSKLFTKVDPI